MILVPYRLDAGLYKVPVLTILVCVACVMTFFSQLESSERYQANVREFCGSDLRGNQKAIVDRIDDETTGSGCAKVFRAIRNSDNRDELMSTLAAEVKGLDFYSDSGQDLKYKEGALKAGFEHYEISVPIQLTDRIAYKPGQYNVLTMITSTFAHGSWIHLIGNLFFFFAFATCVECVLGTLNFSLCFLLMAIVTSVAYSHSVASGADALPAVGLSGVAMGMMALLTVLVPRARVWCFFWLLLWVRRFTVPIVLIAIWYIGWNIYDVRHDMDSNINYVAHVSGAITGIILGLLYRMFARNRLDALSAVAEF